MAASSIFAGAAPIGLGLGAIGTLAPLLMGGGKQVINPYEQQANEGYSTAATNATNESGLGNTDIQEAEAFQPQQQSTLEQLLSAYQNPYASMPQETNTQNEAAFNRASGDANQQFAGQRANLIDEMSQRGVSPGGNNSALTG